MRAQGGYGDVRVTLRHQLRSGGGRGTTTLPDDHEENQEDDENDQDDDDHDERCVVAVLPHGCCRHIHQTRRCHRAKGNKLVINHLENESTLAGLS